MPYKYTKQQFKYIFEATEPFMWWMKENHNKVRLLQDRINPSIFSVSLTDGNIVYFGDTEINLNEVDVFIVLIDKINLSKYRLLGIIQ